MNAYEENKHRMQKKKRKNGENSLNGKLREDGKS